MSETGPTQRGLYEGLDHVIVPDDLLETYKTSFGKFVGDTRLAELTTVNPEGAVIWSEQVIDKAWDLSGRLARHQESLESTQRRRLYSSEHVDLMNEALQLHGFDSAMAVGVSAVIGNRAMRGVRLSPTEKETLRSLPIGSWSAFTDIIEYTLAAYNEGFEELAQGKLSGVVSETYLSTLADAYTVVGNNFKRPARINLPSAIDTMKKFKLRVLIEGHADFAAQRTDIENDPYLKLGKSFLVKNTQIGKNTQEGALVPLNISTLVDVRGTNFQETLANAQNIYRDLLDGVNEKQRDIRHAGGLRRGGVATAFAASTSILFAQQAAAVPAQPNVVPYLSDTTISVMTVSTPSYEVGTAPTDIAQFAKVMPISVTPAEANKSAQAEVQEADLVSAKPVKVEQIDTSDPLQVATLAAAEGLSSEGIAAVIESSTPATQDTKTEQKPGTAPGVGNDDLRKAMLGNASGLAKWLEGPRGENLSVDVKGQVDIYAQYIESAADDPSILNALLIHKQDFLDGKVLAGQSEVVKALIPTGMEFFTNKKFKGNKLTDDQVQLLAGLWANARASMLTSDEREAILVKAKEAYDNETPNDVGFGENAPSKPGEVKISGKDLESKALKILAESGKSWENRAYALARFMKELDLTRNQASGIIGNYVIEAAGEELDPAIEQIGGGPGRSWGQWGNNEDPELDRFGFFQNADGSFKHGTLRWFADKEGIRWDTREAAAGFTIWELKNTEKAALEALRGTKTVEDAADAIMNKFERPAERNVGPRAAAAVRTLRGFENVIDRLTAEAKKSAEKPKDSAENGKYAQLWPGLNDETKQAIIHVLENTKNKDSQLKDYRTQPQIERFEKAKEKNGELSNDVLRQVDGNPNHKLYIEAAEAFKAMNEEYEQYTNGKDSLTLMDGNGAAYRTRESQQKIYDEIKAKNGGVPPPRARVARPGTSRHGWALAFDLANVEYGSKKSNWMLANAWRFGFLHGWEHDPSNSEGYPEPWHFNSWHLGEVN